MPRPASVPKLTHHKASGKAVVRLSGTDVYCGAFGTPAAAAAYDRAVAEWLARGRAPDPARRPGPGPDTPGPAPGVSVNEVLLAFWRHANGHYRTPDGKPTSQLAEYRQTLRIVRELYGLDPAAAFGPLALKAVRAKMVQDGLSRAEVNRRVGLARRVFKWAAGEELVPFDVFHRLTTVGGLQRGRTEAPDAAPVGPVADAAVDATLPFLSSPVRGLIRFMRLTGCRPGEACRVRGCDLDRSGAVWVFRPAGHKTAHRGKGRAIPVGPRAQAVLREFLTGDPAAYVFDPRRAVAERNAARSAARATPRYPSHAARNAGVRAVAPQRAPGGRYTTAVVDRAVRRAVGRANRMREGQAAAGGVEVVPVPDWAPNQIRHAHGTTVRRAYGLEAAQCVLGHEKADVTQLYAERNLTLAARVASEIG